LACTNSELTSESMNPFIHFGRSSWTVDRPIACILLNAGQHNTEKRGYRVELKPTIQLFERLTSYSP